MRTVRLYRLGMRWLPRLPEPLIYAACELAALAALAAPGLRRAVLSNLRRVAPQRRGVARLLLAQQLVANVLRHYADLLRLPSWSDAELRARVEVSGLSYLHQVQRAGQGGIMAVAHSGNFSVVLAALAAHGVRLKLFVERVEPPELLELVSALRSRQNLALVALGSETGRELLRSLRQSDIIVLAIDRDLASQHLQVPFFGELARVPAGAAMLARRGVPVLVTFSARIAGSRSAIWVSPPQDFSGREPTDVAAKLIGQLEHDLQLFPESWNVLQPIWPERAYNNGEVSCA